MLSNSQRKQWSCDAEDGWVARIRAQAPDIDSVTFVHGDGPHAGQLVSVKVTHFQAYDLVAEVPRKHSRGLKSPCSAPIPADQCGLAAASCQAS